MTATAIGFAHHPGRAGMVEPKEPEVEMHSHDTHPHAAGPTIPWVASVYRAIFEAAGPISDFFRRARAYNDLSRMDRRILRDIGLSPGELNRVIDGHPPRIHCRDS